MPSSTQKKGTGTFNWVQLNVPVPFFCAILALALPAAAQQATPHKSPRTDIIAPGQEGALVVPGSEHTCVLYVPHDFEPGKLLPLILNMHGEGARPNTWPFRHATGGRGYLIVGLSYGGQKDAGTGGLSNDGVTRLRMMRFITKVRKHVQKHYGFDEKRVVLAGTSMGGWGVNLYGFHARARGKYAGYCIIASGVLTNMPLDYNVARGKPVLLLNGAADPNTKLATANKAKLEDAGALVTQVIIPAAGHLIPTEAAAEAIRAWLERELGANPPAK